MTSTCTCHARAVEGCLGAVGVGLSHAVVRGGLRGDSYMYTHQQGALKGERSSCIGMEDKQKAVVGMEAKKHRFLLNSSSSSWAAIPFPTGTIATWGRTSESWVPGSTTHIRLEGIKISKSHCSICLLAGSDELRVKDSSSNGIFINGVRHKGVEVPLAVGSTLSFPGEPPLPVYTLVEVEERRADACQDPAVLCPNVSKDKDDVEVGAHEEHFTSCAEAAYTADDLRAFDTGSAPGIAPAIDALTASAPAGPVAIDAVPAAPNVAPPADDLAAPAPAGHAAGSAYEPIELGDSQAYELIELGDSQPVHEEDPIVSVDSEPPLASTLGRLPGAMTSTSTSSTLAREPILVDSDEEGAPPPGITEGPARGKAKARDQVLAAAPSTSEPDAVQIVIELGDSSDEDDDAPLMVKKMDANEGASTSTAGTSEAHRTGASSQQRAKPSKVIDLDELDDESLARQLNKGGPTPASLRWARTHQSWHARILLCDHPLPNRPTPAPARFPTSPRVSSQEATAPAVR